MSIAAAYATLRDELPEELIARLLPYWMDRVVDRRYGGFTGYIDSNDEVVVGTDKSAVLNTRILWTFAAAARLLDAPRCRALAERAYAYVVDRLWDPAEKGVYWMVDHRGVGGRTAERSVGLLAGRFDRAQKPRLKGRLHLLRRRAYGLRGSHRGGLPAVAGATVHRAPSARQPAF